MFIKPFADAASQSVTATLAIDLNVIFARFAFCSLLAWLLLLLMGLLMVLLLLLLS